MIRTYAPLWKGHLLLFEPRPAARYDARAGWRVLVIVALLEGLVGPRLGLWRLIGLEPPDVVIRVPLLLVLALALTRWAARIPLSELGLDRWSRWTSIERWYFVQVLVIANVVFSIVAARHWSALAANRGQWSGAAVVAATALAWGFYQELTYRGLLQTELVRRWGTATGIVVSNLLYTFGPLHLYHVESNKAPEQIAVMFAAIFAIGLFFAFLYRRSGNLWMVGILHGVGNWYLVGLPALRG